MLKFTLKKGGKKSTLNFIVKSILDASEDHMLILKLDKQEFSVGFIFGCFFLRLKILDTNAAGFCDAFCGVAIVTFF